jgi:hypothetical protein
LPEIPSMGVAAKGQSYWSKFLVAAILAIPLASPDHRAPVTPDAILP